MAENERKPREIAVWPEREKGREGDFRIILNNVGNSANTYRLKASDPERLCNYHFNKETITLEAGADTTITLTVKFKKTPLAGASRVCGFTVGAVKANGESVSANGQLECPSRLPVWALAACGVVVVAIIAVGVVLAGKGKDSDEQHAGVLTAPPSTTLPTTTMQLSSTPFTTATTTTAQTTSARSTATTTPSSSTTVATSTTTPVTETAPNLNGVWKLEVFDIGSTCGPEASWSSDVTIVREGGSLKTTGIKGTSFIVTGKVDGVTVTIGPGAFPESTGTTTATYIMTIKSNTLMEGREEWTWTDGTVTCSNGTATIRATRIK